MRWLNFRGSVDGVEDGGGEGLVAVATDSSVSLYRITPLTIPRTGEPSTTTTTATTTSPSYQLKSLKEWNTLGVWTSSRRRGSV
ncbi:hypothetical protein F5890DRAFT_1557390 [Lentinula detonsa]|uniref:Uncharacterized protein n=1 Tax=Lentinula detonsa TaxID=2804962 RepID=A0AA38PSG4_9AGAR|nr:hypothetical protein F5890DRAFT_1557390 [Lentinula detonsa]